MISIKRMAYSMEIQHMLISIVSLVHLHCLNTYPVMLGDVIYKHPCHLNTSFCNTKDETPVSKSYIKKYIVFQLLYDLIYIDLGHLFFCISNKIVLFVQNSVIC